MSTTNVIDFLSLNCYSYIYKLKWKVGINMGFPELLRKLRTEKGLSQQKLAELSGISQAAIYQWEKGTRNPKSEQILRLSKALDAPYSSLSQYVIMDSVDKMITSLTDEYKNKTLTSDIINDSNRLMTGITKENALAPTPEEKAAIYKEYLNEMFDNLNENGQRKAVDQVELLTKIPEYQKKD